MYSMKKEKNYRKSPRMNIGFYISLAVCIVAVAGAAWSTYGSIEEYNDMSQETEVEQSSTVKVTEEVSGQSYSRSEENSKQESSESKKEVSKTETSKVESSVSESNTNTKPAVTEEVSTQNPSEPIAKGEIIKGFSPKDPIKSETMNDWRTHNGIDISADEGKPVHAVLSGKVTKMYSDPLLGNIIVIESSGGYELSYCGVTNTSIAKEGNAVNAGETIGYIGKIPSEISDESHLHLEAKLDGEYIDPKILF